MIKSNDSHIQTHPLLLMLVLWLVLAKKNVVCAMFAQFCSLLMDEGFEKLDENLYSGI